MRLSRAHVAQLTADGKEFVVLHSDGDTWPHNKKGDFWKSAAEFVAERGSDTTKTGKTNHTCSANCYYPCLLHFS